MLNNVTVIIPAHNRPERLKRLLDYYLATGVRIIVPDSSADIFPEHEKYPQITYRHFPKMQFLEKIHRILPLIETPYVFYCADDDFTVPESVASITAYLDKHPDVTSAQGHYLTFEYHRNRIVFSPRYIRYFDSRIIAPTAQERLQNYKNFYASNLYGIIRTSAFKEMYSACFDTEGRLRFSNLFLAEVYFNLYSLILGNYVTLPVFYSARENIPGSATFSTVPFSVVSTAPEYKSEYDGFLDTLGEALSTADGISFDDARAAVKATIGMPKYNQHISFMQKFTLFAAKNKWIPCLSALLDWRYRQKGLQAVRGMQSYPCTFMTPEKQRIIDCINKHR